MGFGGGFQSFFEKFSERRSQLPQNTQNSLLRPIWNKHQGVQLYQLHQQSKRHSSGGAAVSAAPTKQTAFMCSVGALLALASGKAERRQVHPLEDAPKNPFNPINPLLILRAQKSVKSVGEHRCLRYVNNGLSGLNGFTCCVIIGLNGFVGGVIIPHNSLNCIF